MSFKLEDFIAAPSQELLNLAKKSDLLDIASHYSIPDVKTSMLKREIKNVIIQFLVDEEFFEPYISYYGLTNRHTVERVRIKKAS